MASDPYIQLFHATDLLNEKLSSNSSLCCLKRSHSFPVNRSSVSVPNVTGTRSLKCCSKEPISTFTFVLKGPSFVHSFRARKQVSISRIDLGIVSSTVVDGRIAAYFSKEAFSNEFQSFFLPFTDKNSSLQIFPNKDLTVTVETERPETELELIFDYVELPIQISKLIASSTPIFQFVERKSFSFKGPSFSFKECSEFFDEGGKAPIKQMYLNTGSKSEKLVELNVNGSDVLAGDIQLHKKGWIFINCNPFRVIDAQSELVLVSRSEQQFTLIIEFIKSIVDN